MAKEGELAASGVVYVLIIMPFFDLVISGLGTILENNQKSQLLVHMGTAAGEHKVKHIKLKMQKWIVRNFTSQLDCSSSGCFITWSMAFYAVNAAPHLLFYPAACVALAILAVKAAAMFVPSKEIQRWSVEVSSAEGTFEAASQFVFMFCIWLSKDKDKGELFSMCTSLLVIAKSRVEKHLMATANSNDSMGAQEKAFLLAFFLPSFFVTTIFRLTSLAVVFACLAPLPDPLLSFYLYGIYYFIYGCVLSAIVGICALRYPTISSLSILERGHAVLGKVLSC